MIRILWPEFQKEHRGHDVASFQVPRPAFRRLQYAASNEKLGVGLGTRLVMMGAAISAPHEDTAGLSIAYVHVVEAHDNY